MSLTAIRKKAKTLNNLVVVSDLHTGCRVGLCPPDGVPVDDGGRYLPSAFQKKVWGMWEEFWGEFVPETVKGEPYGVVCNGDAIDGSHHGSTTQWSHNLGDQVAAAHQILQPVVDGCDGMYFHIRGTEAHVGKSAREEEELARRLGAIPNTEGQHARWDLWKTVGGRLVHFLHHIGTTGSQAYEATAVHKELTEEYLEASRWGRKPPEIIVRSHRHRNIEIGMPVQTASQRHNTGTARAVVTPCWQGKTPFVWKIPGARLSTPQFGGIVIRYHEADGVLFVRSKVWTVDRSQPE